MLIRNAELHYVRVVPSRPNKKYNKDNPTWEVQVRTYDREQKKEWEAQGLRLKAVVPDEEGARPYWKTTIKKRIRKADGTDSSVVEVRGGGKDVDPAIIGNASKGHVRVYQYEYKNDNETGLANVLQGIQLTKLVKYTPKARDDDFDEDEEMEVVEEENDDEDEDEEEMETVEEEEKPKTAPKSPAKPKSKFD